MRDLQLGYHCISAEKDHETQKQAPHDQRHQSGLIILTMCHVTPTSNHHPTAITSASPPVSSAFTYVPELGIPQRMVRLNECANWLTNVHSLTG